MSTAVDSMEKAHLLLKFCKFTDCVFLGLLLWLMIEKVVESCKLVHKQQKGHKTPQAHDEHHQIRVSVCAVVGGDGCRGEGVDFVYLLKNGEKKKKTETFHQRENLLHRGVMIRATEPTAENRPVIELCCVKKWRVKN